MKKQIIRLAMLSILMPLSFYAFLKPKHKAVILHRSGQKRVAKLHKLQFRNEVVNSSGMSK
jgi:hypothetical protein